MTVTAAPESPCLVVLQRELEAGSPSALAAFWQEVTARSAPVVESLADDPTVLLVTFLWQADVGTQRVVLATNLTSSAGAENEPLQRLLNTDCWFLDAGVNDQVHRLKPAQA